MPKDPRLQNWDLFSMWAIPYQKYSSSPQNLNPKQWFPEKKSRENSFQYPNPVGI